MYLVLQVVRWGLALPVFPCSAVCSGLWDRVAFAMLALLLAGVGGSREVTAALLPCGSARPARCMSSFCTPWCPRCIFEGEQVFYPAV